MHEKLTELVPVLPLQVPLQEIIRLVHLQTHANCPIHLTTIVVCEPAPKEPLQLIQCDFVTAMPPVTANKYWGRVRAVGPPDHSISSFRQFTTHHMNERTRHVADVPLNRALRSPVELHTQSLKTPGAAQG